MFEWIFLIPLLPLVGFLLISFAPLYLGRTLSAASAGVVGIVAVGLAAVTTFVMAVELLALPAAEQSVAIVYWNWLQLGQLSLDIGFHFDGLALAMCAVVSGVGFLIHVYSAGYMQGDESFARFFAYLNLFVAAMLVLVLADNLVLLYLGWEGVGLCSCLLIGFWYQDNDNGYAARKAFVVTRVGDTALLIGIFLLFLELGSLNIQTMLNAAETQWQNSEVSWLSIPTICALLLLGGAVGKSAQLPLQTWLPDAMAGPTPVSALIHAATMVTAGVYLIARAHPIFILSELALTVVMWIGLLSLVMAAFSALMQTDIKRILAYSTMSQIGYMFLALGVGAWGTAIFHLMTHAFFKALLFMAAGYVILCVHHKQDIFAMGGLRKQIPLAFWSFVIGSACLSALPLTSGFFSKEAILLQTWHVAPISVWSGAVFVSFLTALYSCRLIFIVFYGEQKTPTESINSIAISLPLIILCVLSLVGGYFVLPLASVFPVVNAFPHVLLPEIIAVAMPFIGIGLGYVFYLKGLEPKFLRAKSLQSLFASGWHFDRLYELLFTRPFEALAAINRSDIVDSFYDRVMAAMTYIHLQLSDWQNGQVRWYAATMAAGLFLIIALVAIL